MKRFVVFELSDHRTGKEGASDCFAGAFATAAEVIRFTHGGWYQIYDAEQEKFLDTYDFAKAQKDQK